MLAEDNNCDQDTDGDSMPDCVDHCPGVYGDDLYGCPPCDQDDDGDGFPDCEDECPYVYDEGPTGCPEVKRKKWHFDGDGDGFHSKVADSNENPGQGWSLGTSGIDCDDMKHKVHKLNSCGKCAPETSGKDWSIDDLKAFSSVSPLLQDMLNEVNQFQDLNIKKSPTKKTGGSTGVFCNNVRIGSESTAIDAAAVLAMELSHVINSSANINLLDQLIEGHINKDDYLNIVYGLEAEGFILQNEILNDFEKNTNDCEKASKTKNPSSDSKYPDKSCPKLRTK